VGGFEIQGLQSVTSAKHQTIGLIGKFLMKALDCIEIPLMAAFGAAGARS
jgi:hypothetical protein